MNTPTPGQLLASRLRRLADEIESAERYGVPLPTSVGLHSWDNLEDASFHLVDPAAFDAWIDYTDPLGEVQEHDDDKSHYRRVNRDANGLTLLISTATPISDQVPA